jgi:hypothetical protein
MFLDLASSRAWRMASIASAFVLKPEPLLRSRVPFSCPTSSTNAHAISPAHAVVSLARESHGLLPVDDAAFPHRRHHVLDRPPGPFGMEAWQDKVDTESQQWTMS